MSSKESSEVVAAVAQLVKERDQYKEKYEHLRKKYDEKIEEARKRKEAKSKDGDGSAGKKAKKDKEQDSLSSTPATTTDSAAKKERAPPKCSICKQPKKEGDHTKCQVELAKKRDDGSSASSSDSS